MKKILVVLTAIAATATLSFAEPYRPAPSRPDVLPNDYLISKEGTVTLAGRNGTISLVDTLRLYDGTIINSVILIAGSGSQRNTLSLKVNGRVEKTMTVGAEASAIQIPLRLVIRRNTQIEIEGHGGVTIYLMGVTADRNGAVPNPAPGPIPVPQPMPQGPRCEVANAGTHNGTWYRYRLLINKQSREGASDLNGILNYVRQYENAGICKGRETKVCALSNEGTVNGTWYKYRTLVGNDPWNGTSDIDSTLAYIATLESERLCYQEERDLAGARCVPLGEGTYAGTWYRYRAAIAKGNTQTVYYGASDFNDNQNFISKLKRAGQCN